MFETEELAILIARRCEISRHGYHHYAHGTMPTELENASVRIVYLEIASGPEDAATVFYAVLDPHPSRKWQGLFSSIVESDTAPLQGVSFHYFRNKPTIRTSYADVGLAAKLPMLQALIHAVNGRLKQ
jgi:hypothetical protein